MIFHIAVCSPDSVLRSRVERQCLEYYARRADACIVEQLESTAALLQQEEAGSRYELYLIELPAANPCCGLQAAAELRRRGVRAPLAFLAHTTAYAYEAFRVDAMQYLHIPFRPEQLTALLDRATEPEYGPVIPVTTAMGLRALPFADIEYLECTHHVVHFHLASGEDVPSLLESPEISDAGEQKASHALAQRQKAVVHPGVGQAEQIGGEGGQHRRQRRVAEGEARIAGHHAPALCKGKPRRQPGRHRKQQHVGGAAADSVTEQGHQQAACRTAHAAQHHAP